MVHYCMCATACVACNFFKAFGTPADLRTRSAVDSGPGDRGQGRAPAAAAPLLQQGRRPAGAPSAACSPAQHRRPLTAPGRPQAWLDPVRLPPADALHSQPDGSPLVFLLQARPRPFPAVRRAEARPPARARRAARAARQVYAPVEDSDAAFHRALLLFLSPHSERLAGAGAARALRCQLPRLNPFYSPDPPASRLPPPLPVRRPGATTRAAGPPRPRGRCSARAARAAGGRGGAGNGARSVARGRAGGYARRGRARPTCAPRAGPCCARGGPRNTLQIAGCPAQRPRPACSCCPSWR